MGAASVPAQAQECPVEGCPSGSCPLQNLPYEEFIPSAPLNRGGRDIPAVVDRPFDPESGNRILVKGFVVDGVTPNFDLDLTKENVQAAADAAFMKETGGAPEARMTVGHMVRVSDAVTAFYRTKGYIVAKGFLPVQTVGPDSLVHIQVIEGRITEIVVENAKGYDQDVLKKPAMGLIGTVPTRQTVESALLYTQDYPGVRLFGTFRPGANLGETRLILQVLEEDNFGYQLGMDNYGTELTGVYRARADVAWKNPFGAGDQLDISLLQSTNPTNTTFGSLGYSIPLGPRGLRMIASASQNGFIVDQKPFDSLKLEGTINTYRVGADWRYDRGRFANWRASAAYVAKSSELTALGTLTVADDAFNLIELESAVDRIDVVYKGVDQATAKVRIGTGGQFTNEDQYETSFAIFEARYTRAQVLTDTQTLVLRVRGQSTDKSISPLEQFSLAGPDAVRAYPVGQLLRHTGQFASLEYQVQAPGFARSPGPFSRQWGDLLQFSLFADYAHGRGAKDNKDRQVDAEISGYGAGVRFGVPGSFQFLVEYAKPISTVESTDGKDGRVYGNLTFSF